MPEAVWQKKNQKKSHVHFSSLFYKISSAKITAHQKCDKFYRWCFALFNSLPDSSVTEIIRNHIKAGTARCSLRKNVVSCFMGKTDRLSVCRKYDSCLMEAKEKVR